MDRREEINPSAKAGRLNRDPGKYGTIAEIGAGQEVARLFFHVGGAAGTIAKTMSAYDMTFSDAIYGDADRYVSRVRLKSMLEHEYQLLVERLGQSKGADTCFFAYANTVAATSFRVKGDGHGWMGVRFQKTPQHPSNDIMIHVRLLDRDNPQQQEAVGLLGVNLIYAAYHYSGNGQEEDFLDSLLEGINPERVEVDVVLTEGEEIGHFDERLLALQLVKKEMTSAVVFDPWGNVRHGSEMFYKKALLVERGSFRPVTRVNLDMIDAAHEAFEVDLNTDQRFAPILEIMEISMTNLLQEGNVDPNDFLARVEILKSLGKTVMVSNYAEFYKLAAHLSQYPRERIGIVLGVPLVREVFKHKYYESLGGGILESFGRLFKDGLKFYVYPALDSETGEEIHVDQLEIDSTARHLYQFLLEEHCVVGLKNRNPKEKPYTSREVARRMVEGDHSWEKLVTEEVAEAIKTNGYFGYTT